jgi:hypothetical protein
LIGISKARPGTWFRIAFMRTALPALLLTMILAPGCKRSEPPAAVSAPRIAKAAEVEATGKVLPPGLHQVAFLTPAPCTSVGPLLASNTTDQKTGGYFFEVFVPQGTQAYLCGARVEKGKVTAIGADPRGLLTLQGTGEIEIRGELTLQPVPPIAAPVELIRLAQ